MILILPGIHVNKRDIKTKSTNRILYQDPYLTYFGLKKQLNKQNYIKIKPYKISMSFQRF